MSHWFYFCLGSLATYRLALMFSKESGPGRIFRKLRQSAPPKSATREGLSCPLCESVWWSAAICGYLYWLGTLDRDVGLWWLGMSAVAVVLNQAFTRGKL